MTTPAMSRDEVYDDIITNGSRTGGMADKRDTWTGWFNVDNPESGNDNGDYETVYRIQRHAQKICSKDYEIAAAECRINGDPYSTFTEDTPSSIIKDNLLRFCTKDGLVCKNEDQFDGSICQDYSIRFRCHYNGDKDTNDGTYPQFDVRIYIILAVVPILIFLLRMLWAYVCRRRRQQRRTERRARHRLNRANGDDIDDDSSSLASGVANAPPAYQDLFGKTGHTTSGSSIFAISRDNIPICLTCARDSCSVASIIGKQRCVQNSAANWQSVPGDTDVDPQRELQHEHTESTNVSQEQQTDSVHWQQHNETEHVNDNTEGSLTEVNLQVPHLNSAFTDAPISFTAPTKEPISPSAPIEAPISPSATIEVTSEPSTPTVELSSPSAATEAPISPSAPMEVTSEPSAPIEVTSEPSAPIEVTSEPSAPLEAPSSPSAPREAPVSPSAPIEVPISPSAPIEAPISPSPPTQTPISPSAPTDAPISPSVPEGAPQSPVEGLCSSTTPTETPNLPTTPIWEPNSPLASTEVSSSLSTPTETPISPSASFKAPSSPLATRHASISEASGEVTIDFTDVDLTNGSSSESTVLDVNSLGDTHTDANSNLDTNNLHQGSNPDQSNPPSSISESLEASTSQSTSLASSDLTLSLNPSFLNPADISEPCACPCHRTIPLKHQSATGYDNHGYALDGDVEANRHPSYPGMHIPAFGFHRVWSDLSVTSSVGQADLPTYEVAIELIKEKTTKEAESQTPPE